MWRVEIFMEQRCRPNRRNWAQLDALMMGMNWTDDDLELEPDAFVKINKKIKYLVNIQPTYAIVGAYME